MSTMSEPPDDDTGDPGSSQRRDDPRWLFAPDLLNAPELRDRLEQPRRQLDPYALYISSHVSLEGEYVEPSPSPSPPLQPQVGNVIDVNEDIQMISPIEEDDSNNIFRNSVVTNLEESSSIPLQSIEPPNSCHGILTSISTNINTKISTHNESRSPTWATENDQLPTPTSLSRSSTLVDGERQLMEDFILASKRQQSRSRKAKTPKKRGEKSMIRIPRKETKITKQLTSQASTHHMVTRSKSRHNYGALG